MRRWAAPAILVLLVVSGCAAHVGEGDVDWNERVVPFRKDVDAGGFKLHVIDAGSGPAVVMIHGYGDSTYCWHKNFQPLVDAGHRVVLVDQPGFGRSEIPPEPWVFGASRQAEAIMAALDRLGIERFSLAGSSMGGGIALYLSDKHPDRVTRAILVSPVCFPFDPPLTTKLPGASHLASTWMGRVVADLSLGDTYFDASRIPDAMRDEYARPLLKPGYGMVLQRIVKEYADAELYAMMERYGDNRVPTLIVWGDHDRWIPPALGPKLRDALADARLVTIPDAGHMAHQETPDKVNPVMVEFLEEADDDAAKPAADEAQPAA